MIGQSFETTDPITQTRLVVVKGAQETGGRGWVTEVHCPQGAAPWVPAHIHRTWTETFEILQGTASYRLGAAVHTLRKGETIVMPPRVPHIHPWNTGSGVMTFRHTNDFGGALGLGTGVLVGDQLQGQENRQADQQRQIDTNQAEIQRQRRDIEKLRRQGEY